MGGAVRVDAAFAAGAREAWTPAAGARLAWRPLPLAAIGLEAWRAELEAEGDTAAIAVWGAGAHLRITPAAGRGWALEPALDFGVERVSADDDEERGAAIAVGGGLFHLARRWNAGVAARHRRLRVEEEPVPVEGGPPVATARDAGLWEVRAEVAIVLGGP
jgi:hypothetical protein